MIKTIIAISLAFTVAGCGMFGTNAGQRAVTLWYEDTDGTVKNRPLHLDQNTGPTFNTGGVFADGHLGVPEPGQAWWN